MVVGAEDPEVSDALSAAGATVVSLPVEEVAQLPESRVSCWSRLT
ncbi:hypothetical protein ACFQ60_10450 [Streptomyces zhihengii]